MTECLSHILFPFSPESFLEHYQAREYFHVERTSPDYYADLFSASEVDVILQSQQLPAGALNVVKDGTRLPVEEWSGVQTLPSGAQQIAIPERIFRLYSSGATLILNQAHFSLPVLNNTCRMLTQELGFPAQMNIYITPRDSAGFVKHTDRHEVLVLQIAGSKRWLLYPGGAPKVEIDLQAGDLLYLPRGLAHAARACEEDSIHITLGLIPAYGFQLIEDLAALASEMDRFQRPLPPRFAGEDAMLAFEADFSAGLQALMAATRASALTDRRRGNLLTNQVQGWPGRFSDLRIVHRMTTDTVVCRRPGILTAVKESGKFLSVEFSDRAVTVPAFIRDELPRILSEDEFAIHEIGGMITDSGKVELIAEFVKAGLLRIVRI